MVDVFVSYKAEDRARLTQMIASLEAEGFYLWWDAHIGGGTDWREEIQQHLDAARCVIVAWSKRSVGPDGHFVCDEASRAKRAGSYVPIKIDEVDPPLGFGGVQALSLVGWKGKRSDPRFQSLVAAVKAHLKDSPVVQRAAIDQPKLSRRVVIGGGAGALVIAGVGSWALLRPGAAAQSNRIAVMSFSNMSGDPGQGYFSDGIAEELRSALSRVGMQVIGRASCDAVKNLEIPAAAAKLGVANILTGSVRRSPATIRVGAQLLNGKDGIEKWAQNYDRAPGDTIKIQSDIAAQVASALSVTLGATKKAALTIGGTSNAEALDIVLQANGHRDGTEDGMRHAIELFNSAIALDPNYAEAYAYKAAVTALFFSYYAHNAAQLRAGLEGAAVIAQKAISLAPKLSVAHSALALIRKNQLDLGAALKESEIAYRLPDSRTDSKLSYARLLSQIGRASDAMRVIEESRASDPLDVNVAEAEANIYSDSRHYARAVDVASTVLSEHPERIQLRWTVARSLMMLGKSNQARSQLTKLPPSDVHRLLGEAVLAVRAGDQASASSSLASIRRRYGDAAHYQYAQIAAQRGQFDQAFTELNQAWTQRDPGLPGIVVDPYLDPVRTDPRFAAQVGRLNIPVE